MLEKLVADAAPDLICLQETKLQESHVKDWEAKLDGYSSRWSCSPRCWELTAEILKPSCPSSEYRDTVSASFP